MPKQASLLGAGVPLDSRLEGHLLWDLAVITPGSGRISLGCVISLYAKHAIDSAQHRLMLHPHASCRSSENAPGGVHRGSTGCGLWFIAAELHVGLSTLGCP